MILLVDIIYLSPTKNERYNRVIVGFVNPDRNFQVDEVNFHQQMIVVWQVQINTQL